MSITRSTLEKIPAMTEFTTVFVPSCFKTLYTEQRVDVPTGNTKKGLLGGIREETTKEMQFVPTGTSDCAVDGPQLSEDITQTIAQMASDGFSVMSMIPITSGSWMYEQGSIGGGGGLNAVQGNTGFSYGYSYTEGVLITFSRNA